MIRTNEKSPPPLNEFINTVDSTTKLDYNNLPSIPYFKFYGNSIVLYDRHAFSYRRKQDNKKSLDNLKLQKFTGNISQATRKYLMRKLSTWMSSIIEYNNTLKCSSYLHTHRPVFITLTLPSKQHHSDKEFKRTIFDYFLKWLQRQTGSTLYFWRAESQKNGNIHFHIIHDSYIDKVKLQTFWNKLLAQHSYDAINKDKYVNGNAPSTHVKVIDDKDMISGYILKYALKVPSIRKIEGRVWGMSDKLRNIAPVINILDSGLKNEIELSIKLKAVTLFQSDYVRVLTITNQPLAERIMTRFYDYKKNHALAIYDYLYHEKPIFNKPVPGTGILDPDPLLSWVPDGSQIEFPFPDGQGTFPRAARSL